MGRADTMADWAPLLIGQLLGDQRVLVFDNRGRATTTRPSPEPVTVPLMVQDRLALADALLSRRSI
jgi:pimeloyl-ACP methyl ester carboxylesterase